MRLCILTAAVELLNELASYLLRIRIRAVAVPAKFFMAPITKGHALTYAAATE